MTSAVPPAPPPPGTIERWAWDYIVATSLEHKLAPGSTPDAWEDGAPVRRLSAPGRPDRLQRLTKAPKTRGLASTVSRARVLHTFLHHELQAAELMAWAILAFPDTPVEFRAGLLRIAQDEVRHMRMYEAQIKRLGHAVGDFPVRDWFWERVPSCETPVAFLATMGLGFESANLEHSRSFAARFRTAGDDEGARVQEVVGEEEVAHVRFGVKWFTAFTGELTFASWCGSLPAPLSPMLMRGRPFQREARVRAGFTGQFLDELEAWKSV